MRRRWVIPLLMPLWASMGQGQDSSSSVLRGRVLQSDGSPAVGAVVRGLVRSVELKDGRLGWMDLPHPEPGRVGADGSYSLKFLANESANYTVEFQLAGHIDQVQHWTGLTPDEPKEIDVQMEAACFLTGHLESTEGNLLVDGWTITGISTVLPEQGESPVSHAVAVDPATGLFRLGPYPVGFVQLQARTRDKRMTRQRLIQVEPKGQGSVVLRVEDLEVHRVLRFLAFNAQYPFLGLDGVAPAPGMEAGDGLVLVDGSGNVVASATKRASGRDEWEIGPVDLGEYSVEVRHPAFQPVRLDSVSPGSLYPIVLKGSAALELEVVDQYGSHLTHYGVLADCGKGVRLASHTFTSIGDPAPAEGRIDGLMPGDVRVIVTPAWGRPKSVVVKDLQPGETRQLRIGLLAPGLLQVAVETPSSEPAPGAEVHYTRKGLRQLYTVEEHDGRLMHIPKRFAIADELGIARIQNASPDDWTFRVWASPFAFSERTNAHTLESRMPVKLRLPVTGRLEGKLFYTGPFDLTNLCVFVYAADQADAFRYMRRGMQDLPWVRADGSFAIQGAPTGRVQLEILVGDRSPNPGFRGDPFYSELIEVNPGTTNVTVDLQDTLQASLRVVPLSAGGDKLGNVDVFVVASKLASVEDRASLAAGRVAELAGPKVIGGGRDLVVRGLVPLLEHRLLLVDRDGHWLADGGPIDGIDPGEEGYAELVISPLEGVVHVQDEHGKELAGVEIGWSCRGWTDPRCKGTTDAQGRLHLILPSGSYGLYRSSQTPQPAATFHWKERSAEDLPLVVQLPPGN